MSPVSSRPRVIVVTPTYNEAESLAATLEGLLSANPDVGVLVVDDSSPDGTGDIADGIAARDPRVEVLHRAAKEGLGRAYLAGFARALEGGADVIVEMDADGSHPADALATLLAALDDGVGASVGSRWIPGGRVVDWPRRRRWLSRAANAYARRILRVPVHDVTAGYRAYRADVLRAILSADVDSRGYCFQIDMTLRILDAGWRIAERPIVFRERAAGRSKMNAAIVVEAMLRVTVWGLARRIRGRRRVVPTGSSAPPLATAPRSATRESR
jgi:dolichol-phosphate mannosyltransferase